MDKPGLRDALPQPRQSDTRNDPFWSSLDSSLSAAAAATPQPAEHVAKRDLDVGLGDVARGVGAGALDLVGGIGELARQASNFGKENAGKQGGDYLEQARANMANKLSPLLDVVAGAGDLAASGAESLNDGMSADAKEALGRRLVDETPEGRLTLGDGAGDIDVWAMKMAQGVGSLLPTLAAGGVTGVAAKASIGRAVTASMVKRGATQEVAEAVAAKAVSKIATGAAVTTGATGSVGSAGVNTRESVLGMSFDELSRSDTFRQAFTRIDQDQQTQHLSDEEKLSLAREETANVASRATMSDAKVWGAAAMGSMMGDAMLFKMLAGKAATGGVLKGAAKGAAGEGISETLEEGVQQYAVNESLNEVAAADIDPMKGVMSSAIEGGLIGMGTGGAVGAVGGARGGKHASQEDGVGPDPVAEPSASVTEDAAGPAVDPVSAFGPQEGGEQAPSATQAEGELNPLGPSGSQFPGVFERDQRGILRVKGDVDALASWAEQADMPYITDGDGIAIPAKYAKQAEKAIKGYRPVAAEPMAEPAPLADVAPAAPPADMPRFSQVDPIADEPAIKRQGFVMRNGDGQSTGEPEPYVRPQSGDELLHESSANWQAGQPHAESAPVDLEALRKESAQRWRDGNKPEAGTPVRTEEDTEQVLNALRAEGVNGWAGRQDPKLDMPKGQEFIPHGPQAGLPAVVGDGVQQAAGKAKGLPLSDTIFAGGPSHGGQADNTNYARPHLSRDQVDRSLGEESIRDPRSPVRQSIEQAGSATDSVFGPLKSLRITRKGKPFASEKEAAMASRKGKEMPVPLNGGGFGVAAIGEVQQAQAQQGAVNQPSSNSAQQDRQDGKTEIAQNGMVIVHGSGNPGMSEQDIQIVRASGQKQGKKGRVYGGFYGTSEQDAHQAQAYADMMGGTPTLYDVKIKPGTKVLHKQGDITRLSESYINELVSQGYGVVTGTDPRGQTEHVVIDKSAVASMAPRGAQATPSQVNDTNVADMRQPSDQPAASVSAETVPAPSATAGEASQLAPAIDTGYREVIPVKQPKTEVSNEPVTPVPAISSERSGDQPGAGDPVATSVGPTPAELAERAGPGDPADGTSLAPVPVTQPGEENSLTAPAPAGVAVSEEAQAEQARTTAGPAAAPTPWSEMIDNPDGTITLKGEVPAIKQWAKDNGVKAIPGKGGLVVSTTSVAKVRQLTTPATSEPVRQIEAARAEIAPEPTEAQKEAGNYKKGHIKLQGLDIALENPKGSTRSGTDQDGKAWQSTMAHDYGYIKRTLGADGDHVDVFIGDKPDSETVYVVDQVDPKTGKFDEHKVMMGFSDEQAAREGYLGNYEAGWKGLGAIKAMPVESFKRWVKEGDTTKPADSMESEPVDANALADEEAIAVADELGIEHGDNPDDARWGLDGIKADVLAAAVGRVRNPGEPVAIKRPLDNPNIVAAPPMEGDPVTRAKKVRMSQQREGGYEGLSVDEATRIVDDFLADFNGNIPLKPFIREKVSEIYRNVADDSDTARTTKGAYHPSADLFTVVAGNARGTVSGSPALRLQKGRLRESVELGAKADLLKTLRHELLGHYGLDTFAPEDKRALLQKLIAAQKEPWLAPAWRHASNLGDQLDAIKEHERELAVAEEAFARLAERELPSRAIQTWNDIKATFSRLLRKIGLVKGPIKEHELDSLIRAVSKGIRNGERTRQNIRGDKEVIGKQADEPAKDDKPERIIRFSKQAMAQGDKPAKHLTRKEAELVSHGWFKQYRGASGIKVQIHATQAELEGALGLDAKDGLIRRAAFDDDAGTLHVAADTISDPKRMREILRHEVLAHYGLANVLGDGEYTKLMSRLIGSQKDPSMKPVWDWVNTHYADEDIGTKAEEVVAHLAELEQGAWGRGWDRVVAWVTRALRAVGFVPDGITAAETRSLIEGLGKKLQRSGPDDSGPDGGKKFSQEAERPAQKGGIKMSQASTAADAAMEKLNLGPKPDIIDKTKASLNKLRQVDRGVVSSWIDRVIKKANTEVLDALAPIKYAEEAAGITDAADSGYVAARMATGAASTMQATMLYGLPEWKDGVIQRKAGTGEKDALLGIFADLGADLHNWLGWMAGHRAELLMAQGRENLLDANDIAALKGQGKGKEAKFLDAKARWNRLNAATLDLAQEAGLFTKEARAEFESEWYIPFFRESDDGDVIAPFKTKGIANQNSGIKKLKGGEANTNDLLENIFTSTSKLIDASMKNMAAQKTVWNLADTGIIEVIPKPNKMDYQALANGKDRIMVKLEGEDYMIRVEDPDLYRAMTFFDRKPFGAMVNVAAKAKRLLTAGVTASPEFMLRNFLRDSLSSWAISKDGFRPVIDSIKGVKKTLAMDGSTIDVMFSGASFLGGYVNGNDPEAMADTVRKSLRRKGMTPEQIARYEKSIIRNAAQAKGVVANVWEKYNRYGEAFENANREAVYAAAIKAGKSHAQAAFESKDLMDFSMLGASRTMQVMTQLLPFFNARVQGLGKLTRELRDNPGAIAKRAGMITAASLALLAANWDDERYEELPDWDKDANWHFFVGDQHFRIPKPFEIGVLFGTIPERMVRAMGGKDTGAQLGKAIARAVGETFALNPTPQIVKPLVESYFNYDAFRGIPIENAQDLAVQAEARYNEQTSLMMRELGETLGMSPKKLEHLLIGYTGTIGSYVMATADGLIRASRPGESASWRADEIPLVKAVYRGTGPAKSTQHMEEFYRMLNEVNQLKRTVDQYRSEGLTDKANELLEEQGGILKSRRSLSRTQQQVRVVRNKIELIQRDRTLTAEEKRRRIDEMLARRNDLVYQAVNKNKSNWE
ncbi:LPD38 domain-containing protein [Aeromonas caviae]|uniref:LPD38 domain-containing protein n=1 Tax=Aeromonas caviae TaxID=648 RepID=UPI0038CF9876